MNRGARDYSSRLNVGRNLALGALLALAAALCCLAPPIAGKPLFGYLASVLLLAASACAAPAAVRASSRLGTRFAGSLLGVEGFLASRSIGAALSRTAVLVAALSTAVAMMVSIAVLVGSFRETILLWMDRQLQADLYIRPAGEPAFDRFPTLAGEVAERVAEAPGVARVDRFRAYPIRYDGAPAVLGVGDVAARSGLRFLEGGSAERILERLRTGDNVIVSEPFARKHEVWTGDRVRLPLRGRAAEFVVAGVYYDYASERGAIIGDRRAFSKYLPDDDVSSLAIVLEPGADPDRTRERITEATAGRELYIVSNARIRREAAAIFDRTFAITYALEAVAVITAILGMAGGLTALVIDRKRELAVLRFLGASGSQIQKLIFAESGLLALLSAGLGAGLGAALSLVLVFVINRQSFGWTIQWHWPTAVVAAALGAVVLSALPAGVSPARAARRMDPIEAVREG